MITVEKLQVNDIPQLLLLYKQLVDFENTQQQAIETYEKICNNDNYLLVAAKDGKRLVGTALGVCCCMDIAVLSRPFMVVESVVVDESCRGMGVGKLIFERLDEFAKEHNCADSIIVSSGHRKGAHKFYESLGYNDDVRGFRKNYFD